MTQDTRRVLTILLFILIGVVVIMLLTSMMNRDVVELGDNTRQTPSQTTGGNQAPAVPSNTNGATTTDSTGTGLTLITPTGGQRFVAGDTVTISWNAPQSLANSRMTITLMQGDRVVSTLTSSQVTAGAGTFSWTVPNLGAQASTDGYSLVLSTGNVRIESGEFRIFPS